MEDIQNNSNLQMSNRKSKNSALVIISLILSIICVLSCIFIFAKINKLENVFYSLEFEQRNLNSNLDSLKTKFYDLQYEYLVDKIKNLKGYVDLTSSSIQDIGDGFMVVRLNVIQHLTGIKVSGRMINSTSLKHKNIEFNITAGGKSKDFFINQISSGNSTWFSVYIPDVPIEKTNYANIKYSQSTVTYYKN